MLKNLRYFLFVAVVIMSFGPISGQTYNDGPMELQVRLVRFQADFSTFSDVTIDLGPFPVPPTISRDEYSFQIWGRANQDVNISGWLGPVCVTDTVDVVANINSIIYDTVFYAEQFLGPTVPRFFDLKVEAWEDDVPADFDLIPSNVLGVLNLCETIDGKSLCVFEPSQNCADPPFFPPTLNEGDDRHCDANPYSTSEDYRAAGPPCQWNAHGAIAGACTTEVYRPVIESYWRYLDGDSCTIPIAMGALTPGFGSLTPHFNSNECYNDGVNTLGGGLDVVYQITVTDPVGLVANTSGPGTAFTDIAILDGNCTQIDFNSGAPNSGSEVQIPLCVPGTYYIVVEGRAGSQGTFTLSLTENPSLVVSAHAGQDETMCIGSNTVIGGSPTGTAGAPVYSYQWAPNGNTLSDDTLANPIAFPQTSTTYYVTVTDQNGCASLDSMTVIVSPGPQFSIGPDTNSICPGDSFYLNAGQGFTNYFWSNGSTDTSIYANSPGTYFVAVTDFLGCLGRDSVVINFDAAPMVVLGPADTSICDFSDIVLDAGAGAGWNYQWAPGGDTTQSITVNSANIYTVTVTDASTNCATVENINLGIDPLPIVNLGPDADICPGDTFVLDAGAGLTAYTWNTGAPDQMIFVSNTGAYEVTVTSAENCSSSDTINILMFPQEIVNLGPDMDLCPGSPVTLDAGAGFIAYSWLNGDSTQTVEISSSGTQIVIATDTNDCKVRDTIILNIAIIPEINLGTDADICPDEQIVLDAGGGFTGYAWSTGETGQSITVVEQGTYSVTATEMGCDVIDAINIGDNCPGELIMPNVFSPNNDGINDLLDVQGVNLNEYELNIYDRWGNKIFTSTSLTAMWDGTFKNKDMPEGVYFYHIKFLISGREEAEERKGNITLLR